MPQDNTLDSMAKKFADLAELQAYSDAQYKTIIDLNKKINKLSEEKANLERLLPVGPSETGIIQFPSLGLTDEEEICISQLKTLNDISKRGQLTLEEAKKVEIYTKLLLSIRGKNKDIDTPSKKIPTEELLAIAGTLTGDGI